ncbi:MAG TPA: isoprenylcysteine carboxylmethyltransferase family protein [Steroidobacteraceae bacterium]|jgi:protein-S-isoprenylcysteine O-methyltransferase Ste14
MHLAFSFRQLMLNLWLVWALFWLVSAATAKPTQRRESPGSRLSHLLPLLLGVYLIVWPRARWPGMSAQLLPDVGARYWVAVVLVVLGLGFTVWARLHLGKNWSGTVTQKQGHELIRSGPYGWVRHPIYTGLLAALLGSAIALGELRGLLGLLIVLGSFWRKLRIEEGFMRELFPGQYQRYMDEVPALVPFTRARRSAPR